MSTLSKHINQTKAHDVNSQHMALHKPMLSMVGTWQIMSKTVYQQSIPHSSNLQSLEMQQCAILHDPAHQDNRHQLLP
jgi:hypothetical protein